MDSDTLGAHSFSVHRADRAGGGIELTVFGELDMATAPRLRTELEGAIATDRDVTIDLRACSFMDSSGVAALVAGAWRMKERGRVLHLRGARERVLGTLQLAGLHDHDSIVLESDADAT